MTWNTFCVILLIIIYLVTVFVTAQDLPEKKCYKCTSSLATDKCYTGIGFQNTDLVDCANECFTSRVETTIKRGCLVGTTDCTDDNTCIKCTGEMCNKDPLPEVKECIDCDSSITPNCAIADKLDTVAGVKCAITVTQCFSEVDVNGITKRGCGAGSATNNLLCNTNKCNTAVFPTTRQTCHQCKNTETDCINPLTDDKYALACNKYKDNDKCYSLYTPDGKSRRGCVSDPDYPSTCATDVNCKQCDAKNCNTEKIEAPPVNAKCIVCDSKNEPKCATVKDIITLSIDCPPASKCFVETDKDGNTVRGCGEGTSLNKEVCTSDNCNKDLYPKLRKKCKKCLPENIECETATDIDSTACIKYVPNDECYSSMKDGKFKRGCISDADQTCNTDICKKCSTNDCNIHKTENPAILKCISCENSVEECEWLYDAKEAKPCKNAVPLGKKEECFINVDDKKVNRGCKLDEKPEKCVDGKCETCGEDACNIKNISVNKCIVCDSSNKSQSTCSVKADGISSTLCKNQTFAGFGCFTYKNDKNIVTRGCKSDLSADQKKDCNLNKNNCSICTGDGCNKEEPNSSTTLQVMSLSILLGFFTLIKYIF